MILRLYRNHHIYTNLQIIICCLRCYACMGFLIPLQHYQKDYVTFLLGDTGIAAGYGTLEKMK